MNSVSTCTQLETNDNSLNVADSGKLGDNVDGAELFVVHTELQLLIPSWIFHVGQSNKWYYHRKYDHTDTVKITGSTQLDPEDSVLS